MMYLFYGNDIKLIKKKVQEWEEDFFNKNPNVEKILIENFNEQVFNELKGENLFFSKRYIKIYIQRKDEIKLVIKNKSNSDIIIMIFYTDKEIEKINDDIKTFQFFVPKPYHIANILFDRFKKRIDPIVVDFLSKNITSILDIDSIDNFLQKNPDKALSINDITFIISEIEVSVFSIIDDIINRRKATAINEIINFLDGSNYNVFMRNLFLTFRILYGIKKMINENKNENEITKTINLHPYIVKKYIEIAKKTDIGKLENILINFPIIDMESKKFSDNYFLERVSLEF